jgi:hypothetical protein
MCAIVDWETGIADEDTLPRLDTERICATLTGVAMHWTKPEATEIKMDAEISSYQDDDFDPLKDGPLFAKESPREVDFEDAIPRA